LARVTRKSIISGIVRTLELKRYTQEEFERKYHSVKEGKVSLEEAFPDISQNAKNFIVYGTTEKEWELTEYGENRGEIPLIFDTYK
jgi:hypothetical protein